MRESSETGFPGLRSKQTRLAWIGGGWGNES